MPIVRVPDGRQVRFPDNMPREQIKAFIMEKLPQTKSAEPLSQEQLADVDRKATELRNNLGIDTSSGVASSALSGFGKGVLGGLERLAGGASLGISDWVGDKLGTGVKERRQELEELNPIIKGLNIGTDLAGGVLTGGGLYKGVAKGLGAIPKVGKAAQYLAPTVTGAVSGGAYSGFENDSLDSAKTGALMGGAIGAGSDLALRGLGKVWSAASKVKNTPRGFENAVGTKDGARTLNRAVRESDKIAEEVYAKAPETLETLNARAMDKLDDAVKGGVDVKGRMSGAKKAYGDFIDENKAKQIISGTDDLSSLKGTAIVDEAGKPLKVYHGSPKKFDKFYQENGDYNFTPSKDFAKKFANDRIKEIGKGNENIYDAYLNAKNVFDPTNKESINQLKKTLENQGISKIYSGGNSVSIDDFMKSIKDGNWKTIENGMPDLGVMVPTRRIPTYIKDAGFDGYYKIEDGVKNVSVFDPKQIVMANSIKKSAPKVSDLGIKGLTENQQNWLNQAWTAGKRNTLEKAGSLGHLDEMSKELNKMVQASRLPNATGVGTVATPETVALQGLKDKVDDVIEKAGLKSIKAQYRQAKTLEDSFNRGLKFKPTEIKTRDLTFKTPEEKSAFAKGLIEQIKMNPETKNIAGKARDLRGALRKVLGDDAKGIFNEIDNINKSYKNVEKILGNAERKLSVPEPINGRIGLLRELIESPGSLVGGTADFARRWGTAKSAERAAKYLLNPNLKIGKSPYDAMRLYLPTLGSILETNVMKGDQ